ncbi:hypothetical protein B0H14DRAFT_3774471 [Mycena olivaceomarginata]|nr:hypothetical protein B0H14DRAFT_3774471 [Mycena olivaceomarginata]
MCNIGKEGKEFLHPIPRLDWLPNGSAQACVLPRRHQCYHIHCTPHNIQEAMGLKGDDDAYNRRFRMVKHYVQENLSVFKHISEQEKGRISTMIAKNRQYGIPFQFSMRHGGDDIYTPQRESAPELLQFLLRSISPYGLVKVLGWVQKISCNLLMCYGLKLMQRHRQTTEAGRPIPNKKVCHVLVDRLRILDHGDGEPWNPAVPAIPQSRFYSLVNSPQRRGRDDAADSAFNNFGAKSASPSPPKRARRNAGTQ